MTLTLTDDEARAFAMVAGSLNLDHYQYAVRRWTNENSTLEFPKGAARGATALNAAYLRSPVIDERAVIGAMREAVAKLDAALSVGSNTLVMPVVW